MVIKNKEQIAGTWEEFVSNRLNMMSLENPDKKIYEAVVISDELFEALSGKPVRARLGNTWESYQRCPICGEYMFHIERKRLGIVEYDEEGNEMYVKDLIPRVNKRQCRCGIEIFIDNEKTED